MRVGRSSLGYRKVWLLITSLLIALVTVSEGVVKEQIGPVKVNGLKAYILDKKNEETLMFVDALVVDTAGIIMIDARAVRKWLEDVSYNLVVKDISGRVLQIDRLIAMSAKHGKALASLEMHGRRFDRTSEIGSSYTEFIKAAIEKYKKGKAPEATVMAPSIAPIAPAVPKVPEAKPPDIAHYKEVGLRMLQAKRFADAEALYKKVVEIDPKDYEALFTLALIYTNTGRFEEAESLYKRAYSLKGERKTLKRLGTLYVLLKRYEEAVTSLQTLLKDEPNDTDALYTLALTYMFLGNKDAALNEYLRLKKVDPQKAEDLFDLLYR